MTATDPPLLIEHECGDVYFTGDLEAGQSLAARDRCIVVRPDGDWRWRVFLLDAERTLDEIEESLAAGMWPANTAEWGVGATKEEAWRFALGAMFGPIDEEYDEEALRRALEEES